MRHFVCILLLLILSLSHAQSVQRIVLLPFDAANANEAYSLGLPSAVRRSLNVVDGLFTPPMTDVIGASRRLQSLGQHSPHRFAVDFEASLVVVGRLSSSGNNISLQLLMFDAQGQEVNNVLLQGDVNDPQTLSAQSVNAILMQLGVNLTANDQGQVAQVISSVPSLPSLRLAALSETRLVSISNAEFDAASALAPSSSWLLSERARNLSQSGRMDEALQHAAQAVGFNPQDIEAWIIKGFIEGFMGQVDAASSSFAQALALNPSHAQAVQGRSRTQSSLEARIADLEQAITLYPRFANAYLELAELYREQNDPKAIQVLRTGALKAVDSLNLHRSFILEAVATGDSSGAAAYISQLASSENNSNYYRLAILLPSSHFADALNIVRQGQQRFPGEAAPILAEAELYEQQEQYPSALATLQRALDLAPNNIEIINALALSFARAGELDSARATLESAAGSSQNSTLNFNLAQIYLEAGQDEAALGVLEGLFNYLVDDAEYLTIYGIALGRVGRSEQALNVLDRALSLNPNASQAIEVKQAIEQAVAALPEGVEQNDSMSDAQRGLFETGLAELEGRNFEQAIQQLEQAQSYGEHGAITFYLSAAYQAVGRYNDAITGYEKLVESRPDDSTVLNNLGFAYFQVNNYIRALDFLEQAIASDPENVDANLNLGLAYYSLGQFAKVIAPLEQVVRLRPELANMMVNINQTDTTLSIAQIISNAKSQ